MNEEIERLDKRFRRTPILCADGLGQRATLVTLDDAAAKHLVGSQQPIVCMGMPVALFKFKRLVANEGITTSFTANQLAAICGAGYMLINSWFEAGILVPDGEGSHPRERRSSFTTAFACGVCGALRRQGVMLPTLKRVADLLRSIGKPQSFACAERIE